MSGLDGLNACAGQWRGTNRLHDPNTGKPEDSPGTATVTPVLGGWFVRIDYTWSYQGKPQAGSFLVGFYAKANAVSAYWIDSWHMGHLGMECRGTLGSAGGVSLRGSYAAPPDPDWGWLTEIIPAGGKSLRVTMHNISPDGREEIAVEAEYTR